jgi:hypothetical protein
MTHPVARLWRALGPVHPTVPVAAPFEGNGVIGLWHTVLAQSALAGATSNTSEVSVSTNLVAGKCLATVFDQDARNEIWSGPSSTENNTRIISFVLTLPLTFEDCRGRRSWDAELGF